MLILERVKFLEKKLCRFEAIEVEPEDCEKIIAESWKVDTMNVDFETIMDKIDCCNKSLTAWNHQVFERSHTNIKQAKSKL